MAELNDVIGAILKDIVQANVTADRYTGELSQAYAEDPLLSSFSVPHARVVAMELDLTFAVAHANGHHKEKKHTEQPAEYKVTVAVAADELQQIPEAMYSTIKLKTAVTPYTALTD